jgi:hypothetical protein
MQEFNFQHNKQRTADAREADEHIILNKASKEKKARYLCGTNHWKALSLFGTIIAK